MPKNTSPSAAIEAESRRSRNSRTSSDGCEIRASYHAKAARMARPPTIGPSTGRLSHESPSPPWTIPYTSDTRPAMDSSTPT